ncbi:MAG: PAS domain-containing protein [Bacteroidetes bacterium]|nr:PAS domain-containing protein [Bacteroidota bacterium]
MGNKAYDILQKNKDYLSKIIFDENYGTWDWDLKTNRVFFDSSFYKIVGYDIDEFPHRLEEFQNRVHPDDFNMVMEQTQKHLSGKINRFNVKFRFKKKNNDWLWVLERGIIVERDNNGIPQRFSGTLTDITKRKQIAENLKAQNFKYCALLQNLDGMVYHCKNDNHWTMEFISDSCFNLTGYKPEEFIQNKKLSYNDIILPQYQNYLWKTWQKQLKKHEVLEYEYEIKTASGEIKWVLEKGCGIFNENNDLLYLEGFISDITKHKKAENKLKESEAKFRLITENSKDVICIHYPNGKYKYVSPSCKRILGYDNVKLIGTNPFELIHPDDIDNLIKTRGEVKKGADLISTFRIRKKTGEYIWSESVNQPINNAAGNIIYSISSSRDITERVKTREILKKNEERLKELNATKDKFFSIIAHDLINPMGNILNLSELLSEKFSDYNDEQKNEFIKNINETSKHTYNLLLNLLEWSRTQTNRIKFAPQIFSIDEIVINNFDLMKSVAEAKNISLISNLNPDHKIFADKNMITTVMRNLISNAIKFNQNGKITISSFKEDENIKISVIDTGLGIKKENLNKLFRIEENFSTKGTSGEKGTGLGLILCKEFVEKNSGKIWVESEVGKGSKFIITLKKK